MSRTSLFSRVLSILVSIVMVVSMTPIAWAGETDPEPAQREIIETLGEQTYQEVEPLDNDVLFASYAEAQLGIAEAPVSFAKRGVALSGVNQAIYDKIKPEIIQVANGSRTSTVFEVSVGDFGLEKLYWTAGDLGLQTLFDENDDIAKEAVTALSEKVGIDTGAILNTLLANCPYDLYWYDKVEGTVTYMPGVSTVLVDGEWALQLEGSASFAFAVAQGYAAGQYQVDASHAKRVQHAVSKAAAIVEANKDASDLDKLIAYRVAICDLVEYDEVAAGDETTPYGDPWQIISVFDEDTSTNVVCEGYSKAFKYLCDLTSFDNGISCICVTGMMSGGTGAGAHMWNIVSMENGKNYLVDVTNCDAGAIGANDQLFLVGYASGSVEEGYTFKCRNMFAQYTDVIYAYDAETLFLFDYELTISDEAYTPSNYEYVEDGLIFTVYGDHATLTGHTGDLVDVVVPATVRGVSVTSIGSQAFYGSKSLRSISIPSSIKVIEDGYIYADDNWEYIFVGAFSGCTALENVVFGDASVLETIGKCAFQGCTALESIVLPDSLEILEECSFQRCKSLSALELPCSVTTVIANAFYDSGLVTLTLPSSLESFQPGDMYLLKRIVMPEGNDTYKVYDDVLYYYDKYCWYGEDNPEWVVWVYPWKKTDSVYVVPDFIDQFATVAGCLGGGRILRDCPETIDIGNHELVLPIQVDAYIQCSESNPYHTVVNGAVYDKEVSKLEYVSKAKTGELTIPQSVTTINMYAARYSSLSKITLPDSISEIGNDAFEWLADPSTIVVPNEEIAALLEGKYTPQRTTVVIETNSNDLSAAMIDPIDDQVYTGGAIGINPTVTLNGERVDSNNYIVSYKPIPVNAGTITVIITGKGECTGTTTATFEILPRDLSNVSIASIADQVYSGEPVEPLPILTFNGMTLEKDTDYTLAYSNNIAKGTATVTVSGIGNYTGTKSIAFRIVSDNEGPVIESLTVDRTEATVGDTVTFTLRASDESGVLADDWYPYLYLGMPGSTTKALYFKSAGDGAFTATFDITGETVDGTYYVNSVYVKDKFGNLTSSSAYKNVSFVVIDKEFYDNIADVAALDKVMVINSSITMSGVSFDGDLYIAPNAIATLNNCSFSGDIYVLGTLRANSIQVDAIHAKTFILAGNAYGNKTAFLSGSCAFNTLLASDQVIESVPLRIDSKLVSLDGKISVKGAFANIGTMYIQDIPVNATQSGKFYLNEIEIGEADFITVKFVLADGRVFTTDYPVFKGEPDDEGVLNGIPAISASDRRVCIGENIDLLDGVEAVDYEDGDISGGITVSPQSISTEELGAYEVVYSVEDSQGASETKTITVEVVNHVWEEGTITTASNCDNDG